MKNIFLNVLNKNFAARLSGRQACPREARGTGLSAVATNRSFHFGLQSREARDLHPWPVCRVALQRVGKKLFFVFVMAASFMLVRCIPDPLEVKGIPKLKPQIVVSTQIIPNQSLVVLLTKSFGALDATDDSDPQQLISQIAIADAIVLIKGPARTDTLLNLENGFYGGIAIPFQAGDWYELDVNSETLGKVKATAQVKERVAFKEVLAKLSPNGFDDTLVQVTYNALDPKGKNQYMINVQRIRGNNLLQNILNPRAFMKLTSDESFDGTLFGDSFRAFPRNYKPGDTVAVSLANISEDYYRFLTLRQDNRFSLVEFLGEPINYPSNVEGGKGFFNLYLPDVRLFFLE